MKKNLWYLLAALVMGITAYFIYNKNSGRLAGSALSDFAIEDTASIGKISIDDGHNREIHLKRGEGRFWTMNDSFPVQPHQIDLLLKTFIRAGVQSPVSSSSRENVMKVILGDNRRVKVYDRDGKWLKTWYVGRGTANNQGTYAILETPEEGLSDEPFVIEQRGFRGYLTTRFHGIIKDWRWTGVFYHPNLDIEKIQVETPKNPDNGFSILIPKDRKEKMKMYDISNKEVPVDMIDISTYLEGFKSVNVESFESRLSPLQEDSVKSQLPDCKITVTDTQGNTEWCSVYFKSPPQIFEGTVVEIDPERLYVLYKGELCLGQRLTFDKIMKGKADFLHK